jgi:flagellar hook-length control protein FliK
MVNAMARGLLTVSPMDLAPPAPIAPPAAAEAPLAAVAAPDGAAFAAALGAYQARVAKTEPATTGDAATPPGEGAGAEAPAANDALAALIALGLAEAPGLEVPALGEAPPEPGAPQPGIESHAAALPPAAARSAPAAPAAAEPPAPPPAPTLEAAAAPEDEPPAEADTASPQPEAAPKGAAFVATTPAGETVIVAPAPAPIAPKPATPAHTDAAAEGGADAPLQSTEAAKPVQAGDKPRDLALNAAKDTPASSAPPAEAAAPEPRTPAPRAPNVANAPDPAPAQPAAAAQSASAQPPATAATAPSATAAAAAQPLSLDTSSAATPAQPSAGRQVAHEIVRRASGGATQFDVRLDPPELGRVEVRIEVGRDHRVSATFAADTPQTVTELARAAREITQALQASGLDVREDGLSFDLAERQAQRQQPDRDQPGRNADAPAPEDETPIVSRPLTLTSWRGARVDLVA